MLCGNHSQTSQINSKLRKRRTRQCRIRPYPSNSLMAFYQRLQQVAHATNHSIEEVLLQTIRGNLPPSLDDLSPEWHGVVADLQQMSDEPMG